MTTWEVSGHTLGHCVNGFFWSEFTHLSARRRGPGKRGQTGSEPQGPLELLLGADAVDGVPTPGRGPGGPRSSVPLEGLPGTSSCRPVLGTGVPGGGGQDPGCLVVWGENPRHRWQDGGKG